MLSANGREVVVPAIMDYVNAGPFNSTSEFVESVLEILKKELYLFGPIAMSFPVTEEFLHYASGIYSPFPEAGFEGRFVFWHVVRLIGWAYDPEGLFHWIAVNSFGRHWGENGTITVIKKNPGY
ncbi:unnamed protein product [Gongylonema pulchrum]|uniref:Pept_C1 domain-containing protein n=1 Tax=Gongylonema pulchrum TaxID=637853 RepID=A0A183DJZ4_9BILA|nr:unnamed protein product [Gongylonema pulchrum]